MFVVAVSSPQSPVASRHPQLAKRVFAALATVAVSAGLSMLAVGLALVEEMAASLAPPTAIVTLEPAAAYTDIILRGSALFDDPDGDPEGISTYRWLVNGSQIATGDVPQSMLLLLDGTLLSTDGQSPTQSQGLTFVVGHFGQAVQTSEAAGSSLAYAAAGNADPNEGSIEMWVQLAYDLDDPAYDDYPRLFSYVIDDEHSLYVEVTEDRFIVTSRNEGIYYFDGSSGRTIPDQAFFQQAR